MHVFGSGRARWSLVSAICLSYGSAAIFSMVFLLHATFPSIWWSWFFLTLVISLAFLGVGCLVWWYGRQRLIALLFVLVCTSLAWSLLLAVPSNVDSSGRINALSSVSASLGMFVLVLLVAHFPYRFVRPWSACGWRRRLLWGWLLLLGLLSLASASYCLTGTQFPPAALFESWYLGSYCATVISLVGLPLAATRMPMSRRERQQLRLLVAGIGLGFAPWIGLSLLPDLARALWPSLPILSLDDFWTIPALLLIPLTLGYTALRYHVLIFDTVVAQVICGVMRGVGLVLCAYLGWLGLVLCPPTPLALALVVVGTGGLSLGLWSLAHHITTTFLFAERLQDRHLITAALDASSPLSDLPTVVSTMTHLAITISGSQHAFVLLREEASGLYCLEEGSEPASRTSLEQILTTLTHEHYPAPPNEAFQLPPDMQTHLRQAHRPLWLRECLPSPHASALPASLAQVLLVGLPEAGHLLGILILDARADQQPYAGADFDALRDLTTRLRPVLATSLREATQAARRQILDDALAHTVRLGHLAPEDLTQELAHLVAQVVPAQVEVWEQRDTHWQRIALAGTHQDAWATEQTRRFLAQQGQDALPLFALQAAPAHRFPLVLLPVEHEPAYRSRLVAHYARPSLLLPERRHMMELVAGHARGLLREARQRMASEADQALDSHLHTLLQALLRTVPPHTMAEKGLLDATRRLHLAHWQRSLWQAIGGHKEPVFPPPLRHADPNATVLLLMDHPSLTDLLTRACRRQHLSVIVRPTIHEGLSWLREQARPLQAIVLDETVLSLDLEMVIHALWEYLPEPPLIIVCGMHLPASGTPRASSSVVHLSHPFALAHLLHVLAGP